MDEDSKILLNKATVHGDYFLEFERVESCPFHFLLNYLVKKVKNDNKY